MKVLKKRFTNLFSLTQIHPYRFTTIIPVKRKIGPQYNIRGIVQSFMVIEKDASEVQLKKAYINFWKKSQAVDKLDLQDLIELQIKYKIADFTVDEICKIFPKYTTECQLVIGNFFKFWMIIYNTIMHRKEEKYCKLYQPQIMNFFKYLSKFMMLVPKKRQFLYQYFKLINRIQISYKGFFNNDIVQTFRIVLEAYRNFDVFNQNEVYFMLYIISKFNIFVWHYSQATKFVKFWVGKLEPDWYKSQDAGRVSKSLSLLSTHSPEINQKYYDLAQRYQYGQKSPLLYKNSIQGLSRLIQVFQIREDNYMQQKNLNIILCLLNDTAQDRFKFILSTVDQFYRANIWLPEYWLKFFDLLEIKQFNSQVRVSKLFFIFRLLNLFKDSIDKRIIQRSEKSKIMLKKKFNIDMEQVNLKNQYRKIEKVNKNNLSCQSQLANNLRLLSRNSIRTEALVELFFVDIIIDNKIVVEVNSNIHYLMDFETNQKRDNLKGRFKRRVLEKAGYHLINIPVDEFSEGSFQIIRGVYNQVQKLTK